MNLYKKIIENRTIMVKSKTLTKKDKLLLEKIIVSIEKINALSDSFYQLISTKVKTEEWIILINSELFFLYFDGDYESSIWFINNNANIYMIL